MLRTTHFNKPIAIQKWAQISYLLWMISMHVCFLLTQEAQYSLTFSMLWLMPMWLPVRGVMQGKKYTYQWACYLICLYISHGLTLSMVSESFQAIGIFETLSSLMIFALFVARARLGAIWQTRSEA
jgi:uncharacterized membrane protein